MNFLSLKRPVIRRIWLATALLFPIDIAIAQTGEPPTGSQPTIQVPTWLKKVPGGRMELLAGRVFEGNIAVYRAGKPGARALLLIHGLGEAGTDDWKYLIPALADDYDVYALDLPGFGRSDKGNHLYSPENYVKAIRTTVARQIGRPFTLIGHSMGAAVALAYTARYQDQVEHLILVDMAGVLQRSVYAAMFGRAWAKSSGQNNPQASAWIESLMQSLLGQVENMSLDTSMVLNFASMRSKFLNADPNRIAGFALVEHNFSAALRAVARPTLVIWGRDDNVAPLRTGRLAAATISNARLTIIEDAGHSPQLDKPAEFNAIVLAELRNELRLPAYAIGETQNLGDRAAYCNGETGTRYSGNYTRVVLDNCRDIEITDAHIGLLSSNDSQARIVNSRIAGGIQATRSELTLTAGEVKGSPALTLADSSVDAAGTRFDSSSVIARNTGESNVTLRFSVAEVVRDGVRRYAHEVVDLVPYQAW